MSRAGWLAPLLVLGTSGFATPRVVPLTLPSGRVLQVEVMVEDADRAMGLMFRPSLAQDRGMLFVYPHRNYRNFWMRNVFIPIDVAYIRDGQIAQILTMAPAAGAEPSGIRFYASGMAVRHALEMPEGWFARKGIGVGARVDGLD